MDNEPTQVEVNETVTETVSSDQTTIEATEAETTETTEWTAPTSKDEMETLLKASSNKAKTSILKELGVNSIKDFLESKAKVEAAQINIDTITKEKDTYAKEVEELSDKYNSLKQESILNELNIDTEYREDLTKLALDKVTETKTFKDVLVDMTADKYKYAVTGSRSFRMGSEKTDAPLKTTSTLSKKYSFIKD